MDSPRSRLPLGIAAVAIVAALCAGAVWSVRGRLPAQPAPVAVAPAADPALRAENLRLRSEIARLTAERDAALAKSQPAPEMPLATASPVPPMPEPVRSHQPARLHGPPEPNGFSEPQTFTSVSTAN